MRPWTPSGTTRQDRLWQIRRKHLVRTIVPRIQIPVYGRLDTGMDPNDILREIRDTLIVVTERLSSVQESVDRQGEALDKMRNDLENTTQRLLVLESKDLAGQALVARSRLDIIDARVTRLEDHKALRAKDWANIFGTGVQVATGIVVAYIAFKLGWSN